MPISNRKFGVEIECFGLTQTQIVSTLQAVHVQCVAEGYNHRRIFSWKVVSDGSICPGNGHGYETGNEIVSPVLNGEEGLLEVKKVVKALYRAGARVNTSCGLHVHVDASGFGTPDLVNILRRYAQFEQTIDGFMPRSRRERRNSYCDTVINLSRTCMQRLADPYVNDGNTRNFISRTLGESRYFKVNLSAYLRHGTIEFRQHAGTVNHKKITNWIRFCVNFVEQSKIETPVVNNPEINNLESPEEARRLEARQLYQERPQRRLRSDVLERYSLIFNRISHGGSATVRELRNITGMSLNGIRNALSNMRNWYGISLQFSGAGSYGENIRNIVSATIVSTNAPTINWHNRNLTGPINPHPRAPSSSRNIVRNLPNLNPEDTWTRGLEPEIITFFERRTQEFAARRTRAR